MKTFFCAQPSGCPWLSNRCKVERKTLGIGPAVILRVSLIFHNLASACVKLKKIATISLLCLFLFNWFGYRLVTSFLESKADARMEAAIDQDNYSNNSLISIKIPSNVPYYNGTTSFERVDGEIEINGMHYKYVKRRIVKDSLELLCVADVQKNTDPQIGR